MFLLANDSKKTCSLSCQNSFSLALSRNGNSRTWWTKMNRRIGNSESYGVTSPRSDLKGAPNRRRAVGELSSLISQRTCSEMSSLFRSVRQPLARVSCGLVCCGDHEQCSCLPVSVCPGGGRLDLLLSVLTGSATASPDSVAWPLAPLLALLVLLGSTFPLAPVLAFADISTASVGRGDLPGGVTLQLRRSDRERLHGGSASCCTKQVPGGLWHGGVRLGCIKVPLAV